MPRPRTKKELASDHIEEAISQCSKALSKLGGRVRRRAAELPSGPLYNARSYLESVINRLGVVKALVDTQSVDSIVPVPKLEDLFPAVRNAKPKPKDEFERDYDRERNPGC